MISPLPRVHGAVAAQGFELKIVHGARGISPRQFLIRRRVEAAKMLLADQGLPSGEVALGGFGSQSQSRRVAGVTKGGIGEPCGQIRALVAVVSNHKRGEGMPSDW